MTRDTWTIIGTIVTMGSILVALGVSQLNTQIGDLRYEMNARLTDLDGDVANLDRGIDKLGTEVRQVNGRLAGVEIEFGKVDQRLSTLERAIIPAASGTE